MFLQRLKKAAVATFAKGIYAQYSLGELKEHLPLTGLSKKIVPLFEIPTLILPGKMASPCTAN